MANGLSITPQKGRLFKFMVSSGVSPTTYTEMTGVRASSIAFNGSPVDVTTKTSGGWRELLPGGAVTSIDLQVSGIYDSAGVLLKQAINAILNSNNSPVYLEAEIVSGSGDRYIGTWCVSNATRSGAHDNAEMFDMTLQSSGVVIYSAT
jgi:predicted secreted protein